jgi:ABC-type multidrug transport system fused ATPase/permease subunit
VSAAARQRRPLIAAIALSIEADRRSTLLTFLTFGLRPAIPIAITYLVKILIDDAQSGDGHGVIGTAVLIAVAAAMSMATITYPIELNTRMIEATASLVDTRLMTLVARMRIADLEAPDVLDRLEVLRQERVYLSEGGDAFSLLLGAVVRAVVTAVVLATVSPLLLLTPLLAVPSLLATNRAQRLRAEAVDGGARAARLRRSLYRIGSSPEGGKEIRLFGLAQTLRLRHREAAEAGDRPVTETMTRSLAAISAAGLVFAAGYLGSLLFVLYDYGRTTASLGDVVLTVSLVALMNLQVSQAVGILGFMKETVAAAGRLLDLENRIGVQEPRPEPTARPPARLEHGIGLNGVGFRYPGSGAWALRDVSAFLPAGSVVAIVGRNGSGKSTLVKLLAGLYEPTAGQIAVDGGELTPGYDSRWHSVTSAVFQDFARFEMTLGHSIGVGDLDRLDDEAAVLAAAEQGAAAEVVAGLPAGLATEIGRSFPGGAELSGGQWQRVALARARMRSAPCLLLLDEPTAAIDPLAEQQLLGRYLGLARQLATQVRGITLFTSHRMSTTRAADLILLIEDGVIVQSGHHDELMAQHDGPYREMYERQAAAYA